MCKQHHSHANTSEPSVEAFSGSIFSKTYLQRMMTVSWTRNLAFKLCLRWSFLKDGFPAAIWLGWISELCSFDFAGETRSYCWADFGTELKFHQKWQWLASLYAAWLEPFESEVCEVSRFWGAKSQVCRQIPGQSQAITSRAEGEQRSAADAQKIACCALKINCSVCSYVALGKSHFLVILAWKVSKSAAGGAFTMLEALPLTCKRNILAMIFGRSCAKSPVVKCLWSPRSQSWWTCSTKVWPLEDIQANKLRRAWPSVFSCLFFRFVHSWCCMYVSV